MEDHKDWRKILWIGLPLYLAAQACLLAIGETQGVLLLLANTLYLALLAWITRRVTQPQPEDGPPAAVKRWQLWAQIAVIVLVVLLTGLRVNLPIWSDVVGWFYDLGEATLPVEWFGGPGNALANPAQYFLIPLVVLLALGARPGGLGLGWGYRSWRAGLVWVAMPALIAVIALFSGLTLQGLVRGIIGNFFQNGFFEEFLFRGALQTRLRQVMRAPYALAVQALLFGLWHIMSNTGAMGGNLWAGLALCIVSQGVMGLAFGYLFQRTRNLIAPTIAHLASNVMGQLVG